MAIDGTSEALGRVIHELWIDLKSREEEELRVR